MEFVKNAKEINKKKLILDLDNTVLFLSDKSGGHGIEVDFDFFDKYQGFAGGLNPDNILEYTVTYLNGLSIDEGDTLLSNETKTLKIRIEYPHQKSKIYKTLNLKLSLNIEYSPIY